MHLTRKIVFLLLFLIILLLSQDYLFLQWSNVPLTLGLPNWLFYFVFLHMVFAIVFYAFQKKVWKE